MNGCSRFAIAIGCLVLFGCNTTPSPTVTPKPETTTTAAAQTTTAAETTTTAKPADQKEELTPKPTDAPKPATAPAAGDNPPTKAQILHDVQKKIGDEAPATADEPDKSADAGGGANSVDTRFNVPKHAKA